MRSITIVSSLLLSATLSAQAFIDTFSYPNGNLIPGWTQQRGTWQVQSGRLSVTSGSSVWAYITKDGITSTNCVIDGTFYYNTATAVQFGGLATRHPGGNVDTNLLMTKIQNNGGIADFDRVFCYERGATGSSYADIVGGTQVAHFRMVTLDNEFWCEVDANMDGYYELVLPPRPITLVTAAGLVGMSSYQTTEMDDFEYFDAVLAPQPNAAPRIGTNYDLRLVTTMPLAVYVGALSLGNAGIPLGGGRAIPLSADAFAVNTFAVAGLGLVGVTDANGRAAVSIPLPPIAALVGMRLFTSFVTIDGNRPLGIGDISNEQGFVIIQ
jgi:hypothetical protein